MIEAPAGGCVVLGIGNVLMGDEGVGVHVVRAMEGRALPEGVTCVDGGTGGLHLLGLFEGASRVILIDATVDGGEVGRVRRLRPRFSREYPRTLTAHDIGLKDLLDALHLMDRVPEVTLFAVSIGGVGELGTELSGAMARVVPGVVERVLEEVGGG